MSQHPVQQPPHPDANPGYAQQPYPQHPGYQQVLQNNSAAFMEGTKYKEKALIFGIIGFFFLGIVFGPLAIINAKKAEAMNHAATIGKVLGWVDVIFSAIGIIFFFLVLIPAIAGARGY